MTIKNITLHHNDLPDDIVLGDIIAMDCESTGIHNTAKLCLVQISDNGEDVHLVKFDINKPYNAPNLCKLMLDETKQKIFHYAVADAKFLQYNLNISAKNLFCTKMAYRLVCPEKAKHSLGNLVPDFLNIELDKEQQLSDWSVPKLSQEQINYAASDVEHLHVLRTMLLEKLEKENKLEIIKGVNEFIPTLAKLELMDLNSSFLNHH